MQGQCIHLLTACIDRCLATSEHLDTLGRMLQPILWSVSECFASVRAAQQDSPSQRGFRQLLVKLIMRAPKALDPYLRCCQPLPEGANAAGAFATLVYFGSFVDLAGI